MLIGKEERQKYRLVASDVCLKMKGNFAKLLLLNFFERLKSLILLTLFSLFEVKVRPVSA